MKSSQDRFDVAVIGGGFYGTLIALNLSKRFKNVVILEKQSDILLGASSKNQARIHNGYHYPRSFITALRSHHNYARFKAEFNDSIVNKYQMTYAISSNNTKVTSEQFIKFCRRIGSPLYPLSSDIKQLFNEIMIEDAFLVDEDVFDVSKIKNKLKKQLSANKVKIMYKTSVISIQEQNSDIYLKLDSKKSIKATIVINCAYTNINQVLKNSFLPTLPFKYELTEMPLVDLPSPLNTLGITILDGPFFSLMPYPSKKLHTIHHVRYTPHQSTSDFEKLSPKTEHKSSNYLYMIKDMARYIPLVKKAKYYDSFYEIKTVLSYTEKTDARPILFKKNYHIKNFHVVLGAKIDNVYDILEELKKSL